MAYAHRPLTETELGAGVAKLAGPAALPPMRSMVARGMAPLSPRDLVVGLYQLWVLNDEELAETSARTLEGLPPPILSGAIADRDLPAGVLDFLARKLARREDVLEQVVRHPAVDDETLAGLAKVCPEGICEILAENQERWLRCPAIVVGLYHNRLCRMSVVHRMLELAVREGLDIKLPMMEEIRAALELHAVAPERDELFARTVGASEEAEEPGEEATPAEAAGPDEDIDLPLPPEDQAAVAEAEALAEAVLAEPGPAGPEEPPPAGPISRERRLQTLIKMRPLEKIRAALLGDQFDRSVLVRDSNRLVAIATIKSPKVKESEAVAFSANRALAHEVIRYIANRRDWVKLYTVKLNLVMNPKTPLSRAMTLLGFLHGSDVKKIAMSKNIPSALAKAAKQREAARR